MVFVEAYLARVPGRDMIQTFAEFSHEYWGEISVRDSVFFEEHAESIFDFSRTAGTEIGDIAAQPKNIVLFRQLLKTPDAVTSEDVDLIWRYFESMVRITVKAILEDEARDPADPHFWIPKAIREKILQMENFEDIVEKLKSRRVSH
jgi:hypothetical protein